MEIKPILDPEFVPAVLWNRAFEQEAENSSVAVTIGLFRDDKIVAKRAVKVLADADRSFKYIERLLTGQKDLPASGVNMDLLARNGFL